MQNEASFWDRLRRTRGNVFLTLSDSNPGKNTVVDVLDECLFVQSLRARPRPRREITHHDLYLIYSAVWDRGRITLQEIQPSTELGQQREQRLGNGSALLGLLLHAFPEELTKDNHGREVGLRTKDRP